MSLQSRATSPLSEPEARSTAAAPGKIRKPGRIAQGIAALLLCAVALLPNGAQAQQRILAGSLLLSGYRATCGPVETVVQPINDIALAYGGRIFLSPRVFGMPRAQQLFWYTHECAHQIFGPSESAADCWATQQGKIQGWLSRDELDKLTRTMRDLPGDATHQRGPDRITYIEGCYSS
jgi:hypothetical protein